MSDGPLRDYQQTAVDAVLADPRPTCLVSPTGSGKTRMGLAILAELPGRALWLVHRRELLAQTDRLLLQTGLRERVEAVTIQGILAQGGSLEGIHTVIADEAHHYVAEEWTSIFRGYTGRLVGLTATPERVDGRPLGDLFQAMVVAAHYSALVAAGHLVPCRVLRPSEPLWIPSDPLEPKKGLAQDPVAAYLAHGEGRSGFVFTPRIAGAEALAERFTAAGVPAEAVSANTAPEVRDGAIGRLRDGTVRLLTNVYALTEGVDCPSASIAILARGISHVSPYLQIVGRILRPAPGKDEGVLLDLPGLSHLFGMPTDDRVYALTGRGISAPTATPVTVCPLCGASYESGPRACPSCGFVSPAADWTPPHIYNVALRAAYKGAATAPDAREQEYHRLRALARRRGYGLGFVVREYRKLFGEAPPLEDVSPDEYREEFQQLTEFGRMRGYKPGFAAARFHAQFGVWPERKRA